MKRTKNVIKVIAFIVTFICTVIMSAMLYINIKYAHIDKELRLIGSVADYLVGFEDEGSLRERGKKTIGMPVKLSGEAIVEEIYIDSKIRTLVMKPKESVPNVNAVIWLHGGGYAIKKPEDELILMEKFVKQNGAVVIAPDYTLSVEEPYPAAINDCYETLMWVKENSNKLGINENQIFVGGGSAGGGLTIALSLMARDKNEVNIAFQMPIYPMIDHTTIPKGQHKDTLIWDLERNEIAWKVYLGELYGTDYVPSYAVPMLEKDFSNLPPTYTFVGTEDPFYEDTLEYIDKLKQSGINIDYEIYEGAYHAFDIVNTRANISEKAWGNLLKAYDYAVKTYR